MPLSARPLLATCIALILVISACDNPIVAGWAPPATIRVADPTNSEYPIWSLALPPETNVIRYRFVSTDVADGTKTVLVDDTDVDVSNLEGFDDESDWDDRSTDQWVLLGDENTISFSHSEALSEAEARYTLEVTVLSDDRLPGQWSRRDTIVDLTPPDVPTLETPITLTSETASIDFTGPDDTLSHYIVQWNSGIEERVEATGNPPAGQYNIPVTLGDGDSHTLWVRAVDTAGNQSEAAISAITVDLNYGLVTFPSDRNASQSSNPRPVWTWQAPGGSSKVRYAVLNSTGNEAMGQTVVEFDTANPTGTVQPDVDLPADAYTLVAQAWMPATASWSDETSYTVTVTFCEFDAPEVDGEDPVNTLRPTFWWPEIGTNQPYRYQINGQLDTNWTEISDGATTTRTDGGTTYLEFTLTQDLVEGAHTFYLQVQDNDGVWSESGSFPFTIEQSPPRLTGFAVYDSSDVQISGIDLDHIPPGSYIKVSFSETMDVGADPIDPALLVQVNPAIALDSPTDVSVAPNGRTDFEITPTADWVEGQQYSVSVQASVTDLASNELDTTTTSSITLDFAAALSIVTATDTANMPDTELAGIIADLAGIPSEPAAGGVEYVHEISTLDLSGNPARSNITDLTGLEQFAELRFLDLEGATGLDSADLTTADALRPLAKLTYLNISDTNIANLSFLASMPQLRVLLAGKDEAVLGAGYTPITDISALSSISRLQSIDLSGNALDASATNTNAAAQVTDPLTAQTNVKTLVLSNNSTLGEVGFLTGGLSNLEVLFLNGCGLSAIDATNQTVLDEISFSDNPALVSVTGLPAGLTMVNLGGSAVTDLSAIAGLTNITTLIVSGTNLADVSHLNGKTSLTDLTLSGCGLVDADLTGLVTAANLPNLDSLDLSDNSLSDVQTTVGTLTGLTSLDLSGNGITNITTTGANGITALTTLDLSDNSITTLSLSGYWASGFDSLAYLDLSGNEIGNVAPLAGLPSAGSILLARNNLGGTGNSTITNGIAELSALFAIADGPTFPPYPLSYLVFSDNTNMSTTMLSEIDGLKTEVETLKADEDNPFTADGYILRPGDPNPFE